MTPSGHSLHSVLETPDGKTAVLGFYLATLRAAVEFDPDPATRERCTRALAICEKRYGYTAKKRREKILFSFILCVLAAAGILISHFGL